MNWFWKKKEETQPSRLSEIDQKIFSLCLELLQSDYPGTGAHNDEFITEKSRVYIKRNFETQGLIVMVSSAEQDGCFCYRNERSVAINLPYLFYQEIRDASNDRMDRKNNKDKIDLEKILRKFTQEILDVEEK